jgi:single-strand DNA-binding protein
MASLCRVIIVGNLTRDVELKRTPSGNAVAKFGVAVNRKYKDASGEMKEKTNYYDVDVWGKQAETVAQYIGKGSSVLVDGRLDQDHWEDKTTGQKRSKTFVVAENIQFLGSKNQREQTQPQQSSGIPPEVQQVVNDRVEMEEIGF